MDCNQLVELSKALAWPITVLLIFFFLRSEISIVLKRIQGAKLPGGTELSFGTAEIDKLGEQPSPKPVPLPNGSIDTAKVGNVYWLGFDLMWTIDVILRGGPGGSIVHGLRQATHHMSELGSISTPEGKKLLRLLGDGSQRLETDWNRDIRNAVALELNAIANTFGWQLEAAQPIFRSGPTP